jgi:hypothetical protein
MHVLKILTWIFEKEPAVVKNAWLIQNVTINYRFFTIDRNNRTGRRVVVLQGQEREGSGIWVGQGHHQGTGTGRIGIIKRKFHGISKKIDNLGKIVLT